MKRRVCVQTNEQLSAVLSSGDIGTVFLDPAFMDPGSFADDMVLIRSHGVKAGIRTPAFSGVIGRGWFTEHADMLSSLNPDEWLIGHMEDLLLLSSLGLVRKFSLDQSIYICSFFALFELSSMLASSGLADRFVSFTYPLELSLKELMDIRRIETESPPCALSSSSGNTSSFHDQAAFPGAELIVYAKAPLMTSAQCVGRNASGYCRGPQTLYMRDRTGALMCVRNSCRFCTNIIYNSVPTVLFDMEHEIRLLSPDYLRYDFSDETPEEVSAVLGGALPPQGVLTRGHIRKGF